MNELVGPHKYRISTFLSDDTTHSPMQFPQQVKIMLQNTQVVRQHFHRWW